MPRVSVIMATYNCERTLRESIDSIINQTYKDWEFVICDDCSTDNTLIILEEYKRYYPEKFIVLKNNANSKLPFSLNRCLEYASGEYIARMDGDDISEISRLEKQVAFLDRHTDLSVCGTDMIRFDESGEYDYYRSVIKPDKFTLMHEVPFCHATIMMRAQAFRNLHGYTVAPRTVRGQDVDLWFRFYSLGLKGDNIHEPLYKVREDRDFIKRNTFISDWHVTQTRAMGFKLLKYPKIKSYLIPLPLVSALIPRRIKLYRRKVLARKRVE